MSKNEVNRAVRVYHSIVALLLLVAGGGFVGTGIWLRVTDYAGPVSLNYSGNNVFEWVLNFGIALVIIGCFLILASIAALLALARKCVGATFKLIYIIFALVILAVLVFIVVVSIIILVNGDTGPVRDFIGEAWERTVSEEPTAICSIEKRFECRGYQNNDCAGCETGSEGEACAGKLNCAKCDVPADVSKGCYDEIVDSVRSYYLPVAILGSLLGVIVAIDILITCAL